MSLYDPCLSDFDPSALSAPVLSRDLVRAGEGEALTWTPESRDSSLSLLRFIRELNQPPLLELLSSRSRSSGSILLANEPEKNADRIAELSL